MKKTLKLARKFIEGQGGFVSSKTPNELGLKDNKNGTFSSSETNTTECTCEVLSIMGGSMIGHKNDCPIPSHSEKASEEMKMTMGTKHSPAPWKEEETEAGDVFVVMDEGHRVFIGNLEDTCGVCHANAKLIKAAPKLLEACKIALGAFENNNAINWDELREAIEEAEPDYTV